MTFKEMKQLFPGGRVRVFKDENGQKPKKVFYTNPSDLFRYLNAKDWEKIRNWNGICILSSSTKSNNCFYFNWGYGGNPECLENITINKDRMSNW